MQPATGRAVQLRGVGVLWRPGAVPDSAGYREIAALGLNSVRLVLDMLDFDGDRSAETLASLDRHLDAAEREGLWVILMMGRIPGAQFVPRTTQPYDYSIWRDTARQVALRRVWRRLATHVSSRVRVAGLSLFLEPVTEGSVEQWHRLSAVLQREIRAAAPRHLLLVESAAGEFRTRRELTGIELPVERAYPSLVDRNAAWEFYAFELDDYTHQFAPWRPEPSLQRARTYPDSTRIVRLVDGSGSARAFVFDRHYLAAHLDRHVAWATRQRRPLVLWGFGTASRTFTPDLGGASWVQDMRALAEERGLHWGYWMFDTGYYGIRARPELELLRIAPSR